MVVLIVFLLLLNVIFRIKIIKKYKALSNKQISIDPKLMFDKKALQQYVQKNYPQHYKEIFDFRSWMNNLLIMVIGGLLLIIVVYVLSR